jgi:predicted MFS family arabinose efflux permease
VNTGSLEIASTAVLLKNHSFRRLWAAQFCTVTVIYGLSLAGIALVEQQTQSSARTGLVILSSILPAFLASLVSGAVVDRWGKRRVLIASHLARALVALAFWAGTSYLSPRLSLTTVYTVNVAGAIFAQFALPAELALLPDLVEPTSLVPANALLQISMLVAEGLGIVILTPVTIKLFGVSAVGLVGAGLCLLGVILVMALPKDPAPEREPDSSRSAWKDLVADLQGGWRTISQDRLLTVVAIQATVAATLLLVLLSLLPGLISRYFGLAVEDAPLLLLLGGLGFVFGSFLMSRWHRRLGRPAWIAVGLTGLGTSIILLSLLSGWRGQVWLSLLPIFGIGVNLALVIVSARVILQERPPGSMRGRVIAAQLALANAVAILPLLLGGSLADQVGIRPVIGLLGLVALGAGALGLRQVRE